MMKKITIIAALLILIGVIGSLFTFKNGNFKSTVIDEKVIETNDVKQVKVETDNVNLKVESTSDDKASVTLIGNESSTLTVNVEDTILHIQSNAEKQRLFSFDFFPREFELTVSLPEEIYETIDVSSQNGYISMEKLEAEYFNSTAKNGRVNLDTIQGGTIDLHSNNGRIEANNIFADELDINADNGRISLTNIEASITGKTNNGKITLHQEKLLHRTELHSDNGKIDVTLDEKPNHILYDLTSHNGKVTVFGEKNWDIQVGDGKPLLKLSSNNGKITIGDE